MTHGKIERYHRSMKGELSLMPYDVYTGEYLEIIQRSKEAKNKTLQVRMDYNRAVREQGNDL